MALDPFEQLRKQFNYKASSGPMQTIAQNGVFNPEEQNPSKQTMGSLDKLLSVSASPEKTNQDIMNAIKKLDLDGSNIPMSSMGRQILTNRMSDKFGPDYGNNSEVRKVLNMFDSFLSNYNDIANQNMNKSVATGERTLAALRGEK